MAQNVTHLPLTHIRGYCLQCGGYDQHIQGCWCRKCWAAVAPAPKLRAKQCGTCGGTGGEYDPGVWRYADGSGEPPSFEACPDCLGHQVERRAGNDDWQDDPLCPNCGAQLHCAYEDAGEQPCPSCDWKL